MIVNMSILWWFSHFPSESIEYLILLQHTLRCISWNILCRVIKSFCDNYIVPYLIDLAMLLST